MISKNKRDHVFGLHLRRVPHERISQITGIGIETIEQILHRYGHGRADTAYDRHRREHLLDASSEIKFSWPPSTFHENPELSGDGDERENGKSSELNDEPRVKAEEQKNKAEKDDNVAVLALGAALSGAVLVILLIVLNIEPTCPQQTSLVFPCSSASVSDGWDPNAKMNFTMTFQHPYNKDVGVWKTPMNRGDNVTVRGTEIIWNGTYDLSEETGIPNTVISFYNKKSPGDVKCHHFYYLHCPVLDSLLEEKKKQWKQSQEQRPVSRLHQPIFYNLVAFVGSFVIPIERIRMQP